MTPSPKPSSPSDASPSPTPSPQGGANRLRNAVVALVAVVLAIALGLGLQGQSNDMSLEALAEQAVPLDTALVSGKPTLVEFYADWCTSCRAMAGDMAELREVYGDQINFTMLNVDNDKWLPEILSYRVDGIPHFVYLNADGTELGQAIGEQPKTILADNLLAMASGETVLPHGVQAIGQTSDFKAALSGASESSNASSTDPRSHGSQVVTSDS